METGSERRERKLSAIFVADVVGFSAMMERDEDGTLACLQALRREVIDPAVQIHRGRLVKTTGDGFLAEFASPVEAVRCALEVQEATADREFSQHHAVVLRIGINLGDVVVEEDGDVFGDGVNIAARLEQIAEPGGICISGAVHEHVQGKVDCVLESRGEQRVKNIARPINVYYVSRPSKFGSGPKPVDPAASNQPSIAVLPFTNMSADPEQEFFADGISEDIITALSRLHWLFVIARTSTFSYKGHAVDVRHVSRDLGVRYVLEGSVRASGSRIRITGQLIDAESGKHIWAEKYDRSLEDIFAVQDEITRNVVAAIEPHLYAEEGLRLSTQPPESIATWGLVIRALTLVNRVTRAANAEAQSLLQMAVQREPTYARAHSILAWAIWWEGFNQWRGDRASVYKEAEIRAEQALALDPDEPWARMTLGLTLSGSGDHDRALGQFRVALDTHPNWALGRTMFGVALVRAGHFDEAVLETGEALRMSPIDSFAGLYTAFHGLALLAARRFPDALSYLRRSIKGFPDFSSHYNTLISCCGHLGLLDEAQQYMYQRSQVTDLPLRAGLIRTNLSRFAHVEVFVEGLLKAGVPA